MAKKIIIIGIIVALGVIYATVVKKSDIPVGKSLTGYELKETREKNKKSIVFFYAKTCPKCKKTKKYFDSSSEKSTNLYSVDTGKLKAEELLEYEITSVPTIIVFRKNVEVERLSETTVKEENVQKILKEYSETP